MASAHFLRGYEGKCKNLHGHTWKVEVYIQNDKLDKIGMVADFAVLKKELREFLMTMDHICFNDLEYFKKHNPTTEHIAQYIYVHFGKIVAPLKLSKVTVWESEVCGVTYFE